MLGEAASHRALQELKKPLLQEPGTTGRHPPQEPGAAETADSGGLGPGESVLCGSLMSEAPAIQEGKTRSFSGVPPTSSVDTA